MQKVVLTIAILFSTTLGYSQSRYTVAQLNKKDIPAVIGEIPFVESTVKEAIDKNFEKLGYKARKVKDYLVYGGVVLKELDNEPHDIYVMVSRKSRQEKEVSLVTFLIGKGFDNFASDTADASLIDNTKTYINSLREVAAVYDLELQITNQEEIIKKNEKKSEGLADDLITLQKKKKKIEDDIAQNAVDQATQKAENIRQRQILETLKQKRKPANPAAATNTN